ncbi:hypothetical protein ACWZEH_35750 (plasmid) [Streptomyces sp. QTS137]
MLDRALGGALIFATGGAGDGLVQIADDDAGTVRRHRQCSAPGRRRPPGGS